MSGVTPSAAVAPPGPTVRSGLHLVEAKQRSVGVQQVREALQVSGIRA